MGYHSRGSVSAKDPGIFTHKTAIMLQSNNPSNNPTSSDQDYDLPWQSNATRFWWVRHAPVSDMQDIMYGTQDVDADTSDHQQFTSLSKRLPDNAIWFTSHLKRTQQTADAVAAAGINWKERHESNLIGEMEFGDDTGKTHLELIEQRNDPYVGFWPKSPFEKKPGAESMEDVCQRVGEFVASCAKEYTQQDIVCFSHMGTILAALTNALSLDLHNSLSFSINNLSVTRIHHHASLHPDAPIYRVMTVSELHHSTPNS